MKLSETEARRLALATGGVLKVGGQAFNAGREVVDPSRPQPEPEQEEMASAMPQMLAALQSIEQRITQALDRVAASHEPAPAPKPALVDLAKERARAPRSYCIEIVRQADGEASEFVVTRDGKPAYRAVPEIEPDTGLISRVSINPVGGPTYQ